VESEKRRKGRREDEGAKRRGGVKEERQKGGGREEDMGATRACPGFKLSAEDSVRLLERRYVQQLRGETCPEWVSGKFYALWSAHQSAPCVSATASRSQPAVSGGKRRRASAAGTGLLKRKRHAVGSVPAKA